MIISPVSAYVPQIGPDLQVFHYIRRKDFIFHFNNHKAIKKALITEDSLYLKFIDYSLINFFCMVLPLSSISITYTPLMSLLTLI